MNHEVAEAKSGEADEVEDLEPASDNYVLVQPKLASVTSLGECRGLHGRLVIALPVVFERKE